MEANPAIEQLHAIVEGRVQGVGFRAFVVRKAQELGIDGWVRNLWDGRVELAAEGERPKLEKLLKQVQRGPAGAFVSKVTQDFRPASGELHGFRVRPTE